MNNPSISNPPTSIPTEEMIEAGRVSYFHFRRQMDADVLFADLMEEEQEALCHDVYLAMHKASWSEDELVAIQQLCEEQELSEHQLLRCALRLYQRDHLLRKAGETCVWSGDAQRAADFTRPLAASPQLQSTEAVERALRDALDIARKEIVEITCDATVKLRDHGYDCDPPERTYIPALDRIDAAITALTSPAVVEDPHD